MKIHFYTQEQVAFLKLHIQGTSYSDLAELFNKQFGLALPASRIKAACKNRGFSNARNTRFASGHVPQNKGMKGVGGWPPTQFTKGHRPHNWQAVGSERVNGDGYVDIKIAEPNKWRGKHLVLWEQKHGALAKSCVVIFADGDRKNFSINNLVKVSRQELLYLNRYRLIYNDADLTTTGIAVAKVATKMFEKMRDTSKGTEPCKE